MSYGADVMSNTIIFCYDGSFEGFLCCVYNCYYGKKMPSDIVTEDTEQLCFGDYEDIYTESDKAERVNAAIRNRLGPQLSVFIRKAFLSCDPQKDITLLKFIILGFKYGRSVIDRLSDDVVLKTVKIEHYIAEEAHLYLGFVRFSDCGGVLVSEIEPKNSVLPVIAEHFCDRLRRERFLIFDRTHKTALIHDIDRTEIIYIDDFVMPEISEDERKYRSLWRKFYDTIGIKERYNPKCRMNLCPKRYWSCMTEFNRDDASREMIEIEKGKKVPLIS